MKKNNEIYLTFFSETKSLKSSVFYVLTAYLNPYAKFSVVKVKCSPIKTRV